MNLFLILPNGDRRPLHDFVAHTLAYAQAGDIGALDTLNHARGCAIETGAADASTLIGNMMLAPARIGELLQAAPEHAVAMLGAALAHAFTDLKPGSSFAVQPEDADDLARIAPVHKAPSNHH